MGRMGRGPAGFFRTKWGKWPKAPEDRGPCGLAGFSARGAVLGISPPFIPLLIFFYILSLFSLFIYLYIYIIVKLLENIKEYYSRTSCQGEGNLRHRN